MMDLKKDKNEEKEEQKGVVKDILDYIGNIGVYQVTLFLTLGAMGCLLDSIAMNFIGGFMDHWCMVEPLQDFSYAQQQYIAIPDDPETDTGYSECSQFNLDYNDYTNEEFYEWNRTTVLGTPETKCSAWVYDRSLYASTIRNRWDLVCDRSWMVEMVSTVYMAGRMIGSLSCGFISDWLGRKPAIFWFNVVRLLGALMCLYSPGYTLFIIGRFFIAVGYTGAVLCAFVLITELIGSKYRALLGTLWHCIFSLGSMCTPVFAYFLRDETSLQAVTTWPLLVLFLYAVIIHESPRWLLANDKEKEAEEIVHFIGEVNHADLPEKLDLHRLHDNMAEKKKEEEKQTKGTFMDLFKYPNMRRKTLIIYFNWFTNSLVYYGLSLNTGRLAGSVYVNTFLMGAIEIPANFLAIYLMNKIGRKWTIGFSNIFGGIASLLCVVLILMDASSGWLTAFSILGKAGITMAFSGIYVYSVEIYPTGIRNIGMGSSSMCARISGMAAPFVGGPLADIWPPMPSLIFAFFSLVSGVMMFLVPETLNKKLPETIMEAEAFGKKGMNGEDTESLPVTEVKREDISPQNGSIENGYGGHSNKGYDDSQKTAYENITESTAL